MSVVHFMLGPPGKERGLSLAEIHADQYHERCSFHAGTTREGERPLSS